MKANESAALCRILRDLIVADAVIDTKEMDCYEKLKDNFHLNSTDECQGMELTLEQAVNTLRDSSTELCRDILGSCHRLCLSDGNSPRQEALLTLALAKLFDPDLHDVYSCHSCPKLQQNIPDSCVIYIEAEHDKRIDECMRANFRYLYSEFKLAGFEFIYIPRVVQHYAESDPQLVEQIIRFVAPTLSPQARAHSIEQLTNMTTKEFTRDILCNKLGLEMARTTPPALLMKLGTSYVGDDVYSNYLKINIDCDVMDEVQSFIDIFSEMQTGELVVINNVREQQNQFLYSGFYKLLLDTHLMRRNVRSAVMIDPYMCDIYLPGIDRHAKMIRREKVLYTLLMHRCARGETINFKKPTTPREMQKYDRFLQDLQRDYAALYSTFGGSGKVPDMTIASSISSSISLIKSSIAQFESLLYDINEYLPTKTGSCITIHLDPSLITIKQSFSGDYVPISEYQIKY